MLDGEKWRRPRLKTVRAAARLVDSSQQIENVGSLASLEKPVLFVEGVRDAGLPQMLGEFHAVAIGPGQDENIIG